MISVIIPTHNRCNVLERAVKSVQRQKYTDIQIIIVSDGSTDNTKQVVEELSKFDSRIEFVEYFPAMGGNYARNKGIELSKGKYVAFLDDDDEWLDEKLDVQLKLIESDNEMGLVYTDVNIIYEKDKINYITKSSHNGDLRKEILLGNCISTTSSVLIKKEVFNDIGIFDNNLKALQDYDLWIRICQSYKVGLIPKPMLNYYNDINSNQISSVTEKYINAWKYIEKKYDNLFSVLSTKEKKARKVNIYYDLIIRSIRNNNKKLAKQYARQLMKLSFLNGIKMYVISLLKFETLLKMRSRKN